MNNFKNFFILIYKSKIYILTFIVAFILFIWLFFPANIVTAILFNNVYKETGVYIKADKSSLLLVPNVGVSFQTADVMSNKNMYKLGDTTIATPLLSLITMSPDLVVKSESFGGVIDGKISGLKFAAASMEEINLMFNLDNVNLTPALKGNLPLDLSCNMTGSITGTINVLNSSYSTYKINLTLSKILMGKYSFMGIELPEMKLAGGVLEGSFNKGDLVFNNLQLGKPNDPLELKIKGKFSMKYQTNYDLSVELKLSGALEQQFGAMLNIGQLGQSKGTDGYYRFRARGNSRMPIPEITPL